MSSSYRSADLAERFWQHVQKSEGCWEWIGGRLRGGRIGDKWDMENLGYGSFSVKGKTMAAHRFSYELNVGPIPKRLCVLHRCDNPMCVRPDHLFLGTLADNSQDAIAKGRRDEVMAKAWATRRRRPYTQRKPYERLTDALRTEILRLYNIDHFSKREVGRMLNVSPSVVINVVKRAQIGVPYVV